MTIILFAAGLSVVALAFVWWGVGLACEDPWASLDQ